MKIRLWCTAAATALTAALTIGPTATIANAAVAPKPTTDFNNDGFGDIMIGAEQATVNGFAGAGAGTVMFGGPDGITLTGHVVLSQSSPNVPGASEAGDGFASALVGGDLNGDGVDDLVAGVPGEDTTTDTDVGRAIVFFGGPTGFVNPTQLILPAEDRSPGDRFGSALAIGDFDGNGASDLVSLTAFGVVVPYYDGATTLGGADVTGGLTLGTRGRYAPAAGSSGRAAVASAPAAGTVTRAAAGDLDNDGFSDLAVTFLGTDGLAYLSTIRGSATGLDFSSVVTIPGGGRSIAIGDVDNDGIDDAVVGQPIAAESGTGVAGGAVTVYHGSPTGISANDKTSLNQDSAGVPGTGETGDQMGASVAVGDVNKDGFADVYTGLPDENITNTTATTESGATLLLYGTATGLTGTGAVVIHQDTDPQVPGTAEPGDHFGSSVSLIDTNNDGRADPSIGAEGENSGGGGLTVLLGAATMPPPTNGRGYSATLELDPTAHAGASITVD